eukprot:scaffold2858_cov659-Pavlova_lutheri.AAC.16
MPRASQGPSKELVWPPLQLLVGRYLCIALVVQGSFLLGKDEKSQGTGGSRNGPSNAQTRSGTRHGNLGSKLPLTVAHK